MSNLNERLDSLRELVQSQEFLEGKGLSNEVNIRIFCYDPKEEMAVRHFTGKLTSDEKLSCHIIEYNLYHVFLSICDDKRITPKIAPLEDAKGNKYVLSHMERIAKNVNFIEKMKYLSRVLARHSLLLEFTRSWMPCSPIFPMCRYSSCIREHLTAAM